MPLACGSFVLDALTYQIGAGNSPRLLKNTSHGPLPLPLTQALKSHTCTWSTVNAPWPIRLPVYVCGTPTGPSVPTGLIEREYAFVLVRVNSKWSPCPVNSIQVATPSPVLS